MRCVLPQETHGLLTTECSPSRERLTDGPATPLPGAIDAQRSPIRAKPGLHRSYSHGCTIEDVTSRPRAHSCDPTAAFPLLVASNQGRDQSFVAFLHDIPTHVRTLALFPSQARPSHQTRALLCVRAGAAIA